MIFLDFLLLKEEAMYKLTFSKAYFAWAWFWLGLSSFLMALAYVLFPVSQGEVSYQPDFMWLLEHSLINFFVQLAFIVISFFLAKAFFKMELKKHPYFQLMGHVSMAGLFAVYPPFSPFAFLWMLLITATLLKSFARLDWPFIVLLLLLQGALLMGFVYQGLGF